MNGKLVSLAAAALLIATAAHAQSPKSQQSDAPGQRMQDRGSVPGQPGASGYAPGQQRQQRGSKAGEPGASGFAPGRENPSTSGQGDGSRGGTMGDRDPDRDRGNAR